MKLLMFEIHSDESLIEFVRMTNQIDPRQHLKVKSLFDKGRCAFLELRDSSFVYKRLVVRRGDLFYVKNNPRRMR